MDHGLLTGGGSDATDIGPDVSLDQAVPERVQFRGADRAPCPFQYQHLWLLPLDLRSPGPATTQSRPRAGLWNGAPVARKQGPHSWWLGCHAVRLLTGHAAGGAAKPAPQPA